MQPNPRFAWAAGAEQGGAARVPAAANASGAVALAHTVAVANTGAVDSAVSVMGFLNASVAAGHAARAGLPSPPIRQLFNFSKVFVKAGGQTTVTLGLGAGAGGADLPGGPAGALRRGGRRGRAGRRTERP
jgi:hypothetical protein